MNRFDDRFFGELNELSETSLYCKGASDHIDLEDIPGKLFVSKMLEKGKLSQGFAELTTRFAAELAIRSKWRFIFERDFRIRPYQVCTHGKGSIGRSQLHIGFDAIPPGRVISRDWGVSVGLGFDFWPDNVISRECVADYEKFWTRVSDEPELFDATFSELGGYAEPIHGFSGPADAEAMLNSIPHVMQPWLFFGKRMTREDISNLGAFRGFADECIRIFDRIHGAGFCD